MKPINVKKIFLKTAIIILPVLFLSIYYVKMHAAYETPEDSIAEAFNSTGAQVASSEIYFRAVVQGIHNSGSDMAAIGEDLLNCLNIENKDVRTIEDQKQYPFKKVMEGTAITGELARINMQKEEKEGQNYENHLAMSVSGTGRIIDMDRIRQEVVKVLERHGAYINVSSCIQGYFNGRLDNGSIEEICTNALKSVNAKKIESINDSGLLSVSAYSSLISRYIRSNNRKVNISVAMRYNSYLNTTGIWIATPVIYTVY